jgi:haloalkane dehalogenase
MRTEINPRKWRYQKQRWQAIGSEMAYIEVGEGDPIVLLHGNLASDRFVEHRRYLASVARRWRSNLPIHRSLTCSTPSMCTSGSSSSSMTAGSSLGFDWANRHRETVKGVTR